LGESPQQLLVASLSLLPKLQQQQPLFKHKKHKRQKKPQIFETTLLCFPKTYLAVPKESLRPAPPIDIRLLATGFDVGPIDMRFAPCMVDIPYPGPLLLRAFTAEDVNPPSD